MRLVTWLRQPVSKWWLHLLLWPLAFLLLLVGALAVEYGPDAWTRLTTSEDLGARLRRECESVAREALPEHRSRFSLEREAYIRAMHRFARAAGSVMTLARSYCTRALVHVAAFG